MTCKPHDDVKFLVDVNLPKKFSFFHQDGFIHVVDIDPCMTDSQIWEFALLNKYVILTKDADFYHRYLTSSIAPKVVFFQIGNTTLSGLHHFFVLYWDSIKKALDIATFVLVTPNHIKLFE